MEEYLNVYEQNKKLDAMFVELYGETKEIFDKNILEFLVEIGEFANETRCFKYWSKKGMGDRAEVLEEFADCMTMCFYFCNQLNIELNEMKLLSNDRDIINQIIYIYQEVSLLKNDLNKERIIDIFNNLRYLGYSFGFSDDEITSSCLKKINKNIDRINSKVY